MNPLYIAIIGTWVRAGLLLVSVYLVQHHIVTAQQSESLTTMWFDQIINSLPAVIALAMSMWDKYHTRVKFLTAIMPSSGNTEAKVDAYMASPAPKPAITTPADTVPGVPK